LGAFLNLGNIYVKLLVLNELGALFGTFAGTENSAYMGLLIFPGNRTGKALKDPVWRVSPGK